MIKDFKVTLLLICVLSGAFLVEANNKTVLVSPEISEPVKESNYTNVTASIAKNMMELDYNLIVIDVRTEMEYNISHIEGSLNFPFSIFENIIGNMDKNSDILIYCKSGKTSVSACNILVEKKFTNVYNMIGGIEAWKQVGYSLNFSNEKESNTNDSQNNSDLKKIQDDITKKGARWTAGNTSVSGLSLADKKRLCGGNEVAIEEKTEEAREGGLLPSEFDWHNKDGSNWMTSIKFQGCGDCWAFATIGTVEALCKIQLNNPGSSIDLSEQHLVSCGHGSCTAWTLGGPLDYIRDYGVPRESCFPYQGSPMPSCSLACYNWQDHVTSITGWGWVGGDSGVKTVAEIKEEILSGPVPTWMMVYEDFYNYQGGIYEHVAGNGVGGHFVVIVGWSDIGSYWICKNSWGVDWGEGGWFRIKIGVNECGIEQSTAYVSSVILESNTVQFYTNPHVGSITFDGDSYVDSESGIYDADSYTATANAPTGYEFHHWEYDHIGEPGVGVYVPNIMANPATASVSGDGWLKVVFSALITFRIDTAGAGSITYGGADYTDGQSLWETDLPPDYSNTVTITANPQTGYAFTRWECIGMLSFDNELANPTTLHVDGTGVITAVFVASNTPPSVLFLRASSGGARIDPGGEVEKETIFRVYSRVSDIETASSGLTVTLSYRPQGGDWTTETATYNAAKDYWYVDWTIPGDAATGLYDTKVDVEDPQGGTATSTETGEFNIH